MRITLSSIIVDDQEKALAFYRDKLGFVVKEDIPAGGPRWITRASPPPSRGFAARHLPRKRERNSGRFSFKVESDDELASEYLISSH